MLQYILFLRRHGHSLNIYCKNIKRILMRPIHGLICLCSLSESSFSDHYKSASSWDTEVALVIVVYGTAGFDLSDADSPFISAID